MPTVIFLFGWRFFFYADEGNEPIHIHCEKAEKEAKFWLDSETRAITIAFTHKMIARDMREVRKVIATRLTLTKSRKRGMKCRGRRADHEASH